MLFVEFSYDESIKKLPFIESLLKKSNEKKHHRKYFRKLLKKFILKWKLMIKQFAILVNLVHQQ